MASIYELMASPSFDWKTTPLLECPSIYELMASPSFDWKTTPLLEIWEGSTDADGESRIMLESYEGAEIIDILKQALAGNRVVYNGVEVVAPFNLDILKWANETHRLLSYAKAKYICVDGDGIVPTESAKRDGLKAVARVGVPGDHRGIISVTACVPNTQTRLKAITTPTTTP
ncbi:hypothetical protein Sjap_017784 [Stephania japonica]|uniref:Uncharacterized protein n=1 Tax=Stephania japonica TaxID=461633 RepID=A0AAP0I6T4_9MAGN